MLNYSFNSGMKALSNLPKCCMITPPIPALIVTSHVLVFLSFPLHPSLLASFASPLPHPSANSGSNETSIWPARKTQTSLPLWPEERRTCSDKGKVERQDNGSYRQIKYKMDKYYMLRELGKRRHPRLICPSIHLLMLSLRRAVLIADV